MKEKLMQDIIVKCPCETIGEDGLYFVGREVTTGGRRIDIILRDRMRRSLLVEVQVGHLDTKHIDRHIDFCEGFIKNNPNEAIRIMFIANMINPYQKEFLQKRGYEFMEISQNRLYEIAKNNDIEDASDHVVSVTPSSVLFTANDISAKYKGIRDNRGKDLSTELPLPVEMTTATSTSILSRNTIGRVVARIRKEYLDDPSFHTVRRDAESKAKDILNSISNGISSTEEHIRNFLDYMNTENIKGKTGLTRFGKHFTNIITPQICGCPDVFREWIGALWKVEEDELQKVIATLLANKPIKGAGTLLPTFVLHLRESSAFNIWTKNLETNLYETFQVGKLTRISEYERYMHFNRQVNNLLITPFNLEPQEVDLVLSQLPSYCSRP